MDAAVATIIVAGAVQVAGMVIGFLTLWLKTRDVGSKAKEAVAVVESKLDVNTATTEAVEAKADKIVEQTNGVTAVLQKTVEQLDKRIAELEKYNHDVSHKVLDAVHNMQLKLAALPGKGDNRE